MVKTSFKFSDCFNVNSVEINENKNKISAEYKNENESEKKIIASVNANKTASGKNIASVNANKASSEMKSTNASDRQLACGNKIASENRKDKNTVCNENTHNQNVFLKQLELHRTNKFGLVSSVETLILKNEKKFEI